MKLCWGDSTCRQLTWDSCKFASFIHIIFKLEQPHSNLPFHYLYTHSEDLTELIEAISAEPDATIGQQLYSKYTPGSKFSLQSIGANISSTILDQTTNPLYAIYLHGYYRSVNGNGNTADQKREDMKFLGEKVDYYGHTIITDEFTKASGYDSELNAETIRVTNMWMATVQSLYDASALCHTGPDDMDSLTYVSPIDKAAAFYYGTHDDETSSEGGSLYAWVARTRQRFSGDDGFDVNDGMKKGFSTLQSTLTNCLDVWDTEITDEQEYEMDKLVVMLTNQMTIPLVQNLIYYANEVAKVETPDTTTIDYLIVSRSEVSSLILIWLQFLTLYTFIAVRIVYAASTQSM